MAATAAPAMAAPAIHAPPTETTCRTCGRSRPNPTVAGLLNIWTGLGNIYVGQTGKGFLLFLSWLMFTALDAGTFGIFLLIHVFIWAVFILDAVLVAKRMNRGEVVGPWKFF